MSTIFRPSEADLHAYVDKQLAAERQQEVEAWLADYPEEAARIRDWRAINDDLRTALDGILAEPPPARLLEAARRPVQRRRLRPAAIAAALGWLALGSLMGYGVRGPGKAEPPSTPALARNAAIAHAVYTPEVRHPVEVGADQEAHLVQWLSKRLATPLKVPRLADQGYALVGGRLLPGEQGAVAQFMYQDEAGKRLTLYVRNDAAENRETAFRYVQEGRVGVFYWLDGRLGYALSGEMPRESLLAIAEAAYRQLAP